MVITLNIQEKIGSSRYNGGWTKTVDGLDKSRSNGYSIIGDFVPKGVAPVSPGLYLDCGIGGSRINQEHTYNLVEVTSDGECIVIATERESRGRRPTGRDWAVKLWEPIEEWFAGQTSEEDSLRNKIAGLEVELEAARRELARLSGSESK